MNVGRVGTALLATALGCGHPDGSRTNAVQSGEALGSVPSRSTGPSNNSIPLATRPANECGWISIAEVEGLVGKLAESPRESDGGCVYTLPIPQKVREAREKMDKLRESIDKMPGADKTAPRKVHQAEPYAFVLEVDLKYYGIGENVANSTNAILTAWAKDASDTTHAAESYAISHDKLRKALNGWDWPSTYGGRIGHVRITISTLASDLDIPRDKLDTITVRVRDRIPDRPFAMVGYSRDESRDPCSLITRQEAESVLGPLVIPPYRAGGDGPFSYATGPSCAYFTAGHHVVIVTPHWQAGKKEVGLNNGIGGLIASVSGDHSAPSADTLEGPWDQATMSLDGRLMLLKGDRALEIAYRGSSTDESGALKLARIAVPRLSAIKE